jgi:predicted aspartyl protease
MKHRCALSAALVVAAVTCASGPAQAKCTVTSLTFPVTMDGLNPIVSARVNGKDARFIVDSGAFYNGISAEFAVDRKMKTAQVDQTGWRLPANAETAFTGAGGHQTVAKLVRADEFVLAGQGLKDVAFITFSRLTDADGILGQNFLSLFDVEYDFGHGAMKMVVPKGCNDANLAYWAQPGTPYSVMPMEKSPDDTGTRGAIWINGVKMRALFDTGAGTTFITQRAAGRAGVKVTDPGVQEAGFSNGLDRGQFKTWIARFASVKIGDEEIKNGLLEIGDTGADDFEVLVGADFFRSHHVMASNSQNKIYFTYEGGQVFNVAPKASAEPAQAATDGSGK